MFDRGVARASLACACAQGRDELAVYQTSIRTRTRDCRASLVIDTVGYGFCGVLLLVYSTRIQLHGDQHYDLALERSSRTLTPLRYLKIYSCTSILCLQASLHTEYLQCSQNVFSKSAHATVEPSLTLSSLSHR